MKTEIPLPSGEGIFLALQIIRLSNIAYIVKIAIQKTYTYNRKKVVWNDILIQAPGWTIWTKC